MKTLQSSLLPPATEAFSRLRVATYNIHKGVRGMGLRKRLEIHNLGLGIEALDADIVFLQEVRLFHARDARRFERTWFGWPDAGQAEFLAPEGYSVAYRTNCITRDGEHGNALLSRWPLGDVGHHDVSDHRFEQRGLLHVPVQWHDMTVHAVVAHLGLIHSSRVRQVQRLAEYIEASVPAGAPLVVAGDFNDWRERAGARLGRGCGLDSAFARLGVRCPRTFPARWPLVPLDRIYVRHLQVHSACVLSTRPWPHLSDHLPLLAEVHP
jgi:endonuclease/exonuclease/phosphatase family metal-dependent hydrolase